MVEDVARSLRRANLGGRRDCRCRWRRLVGGWALYIRPRPGAANYFGSLGITSVAAYGAGGVELTRFEPRHVYSFSLRQSWNRTRTIDRVGDRWGNHRVDRIFAAACIAKKRAVTRLEAGWLNGEIVDSS